MRSLKDIIISALVPIKKNSLWIKVNEDRGARVFAPQPSGWKEIFFRVSEEDVREKVEEIVDWDFIRRAEFEEGLAGKADAAETSSAITSINEKIPESASSSNQLADKAWVKAVNDLVNYYKKSETYTQAEVNALIGSISQFHYEIVATLPATGESNVLYLLGPKSGTSGDMYEEYVYSNGWVKIGDTSIDLSGYMPKTGGTFTGDVNIYKSDLYVRGQISVEGGEILMTDYPTSDMAAINKGYVDDGLSTKYTKPSDGIPKADLAIDVQNSLQKKYTVETIDADQYLVITRSESYGVYDTIMVIINIYDTVDTILITGLTGNGNLHAVIVGPNYGIYPNIVENDYGVAIQVKDVCSGAQVIDFVGDVVDSVYVEDSFNIFEEYPIEEYQDKLVSGTNIKTINNTSLLGSGDIQISADTSNCVKFGEAINASNGYLTIYGDETFALMLIVVLDDEVSTYFVRGNQSPTVSAEKIEGVDSFQYAKRDDENRTLALYHEDSLTVTPILLSGTMPTITDSASASGEEEEIQSFQIGKELPSGGTAGQVLTKTSGTDYDVEWANVGGGSSDVFLATYGSTTYADIVAAYNAKKMVLCSYDNTIYVLSRIDNNYAYFGGVNQTILYFLRVRASDSVYYKTQYNAEVTSNKVSALSGNETNTTKYPNCKGVYDFVKALADANGLTMP